MGVLKKIDIIFEIDNKIEKKENNEIKENKLFEFSINPFSVINKIKKKRNVFEKNLNSSENDEDSIDIIFGYYKVLEKLFAQYSGKPSDQLHIKAEMVLMIREIKKIANLRVDMTDITDIKPAPKSAALIKDLERDIRDKRKRNQ